MSINVISDAKKRVSQFLDTSLEDIIINSFENAMMLAYVDNIDKCPDMSFPSLDLVVVNRVMDKVKRMEQEVEVAEREEINASKILSFEVGSDSEDEGDKDKVVEEEGGNDDDDHDNDGDNNDDNADGGQGSGGDRDGHSDAPEEYDDDNSRALKKVNPDPSIRETSRSEPPSPSDPREGPANINMEEPREKKQVPQVSISISRV